MPQGRDTTHPPLGIAATALTGVVVAGHLLLAAGYVYDDESRRQALLSTLLPSARPAFQPLSSDVSGYWLFIVAGLLCALGVTWLWQRWSRQHEVPPAPATTLAAQWLIVAIAGLGVGWTLASLVVAGHIGLLDGAPRHAAAALALGNLAVSIAGCALLLLRTRADSTAAARRLARFVPPAGPGVVLLLGAALLAPFLAPAYLQSIVQCGERCVPKWGPVNVLIGAGVVVALIAGIGLWRTQSHRWRVTRGASGLRLPAHAGERRRAGGARRLASGGDIRRGQRRRRLPALAARPLAPGGRRFRLGSALPLELYRARPYARRPARRHARRGYCRAPRPGTTHRDRGARAASDSS